MPVNFVIFQSRFVRHGSEFGDTKSSAAGSHRILSDDFVPHDGAGEKGCGQDRKPISPQIIDNVTKARDFVNAAKDFHSIRAVEMVQGERADHHVKSVRAVGQGEQVVMLQRDFRPIAASGLSEFEHARAAIDGGHADVEFTRPRERDEGAGDVGDTGAEVQNGQRPGGAGPEQALEIMEDQMMAAEAAVGVLEG